jgi:hypothetical protein
MHKKHILILLPFLFITLTLTLDHEPWRDEAQAWLIARESPDLLHLLSRMGYEGTPGLWHFLLYPLAQLGLPYSSMNILNLLIMLSAVFLFVAYSPFTRLHKLFFTFGYFILFEYTVIARNYGLTVFLLFLIFSLHNHRFKKLLPYAAILFLLANASLFGFLMSLVLFSLLFFELSKEQGLISLQAAQIHLKLNRKEISALLMAFSGFFLAVFQLFPPADLNPENASWKMDGGRIMSIPKILEHAFFPYFKLSDYFWFYPIEFYPIGILLFTGSLLLCAKDRRLFTAYLTFALILFTI